MQLPDRTRELVEFVIRCWRIEELAEFAVSRHGYGNDGFGVTYPEDLDPGDDPMPADHVEIYGGYGEAFSFVMHEAAYLAILAEVLRRNERITDAGRVAELSRRLGAA